jgi:prepilin-type N-terminal cleavage/methylation domain-containing protein/prepilin-type processing-associated H-X9-DG protein
MLNSAEHSARSRLRSVSSAFTLVELLVVIAIIVVLVALLLPSLANARRSAEMVVCRNNLRQIGFATRMYAEQFNDHYPDSFALGGAFFRRGLGERTPGDPTSKQEKYGIAAVYSDLRLLPPKGDLWLCPSAQPLMQAFQNTYAHALGFAGTSGHRGRQKSEEVFWVWDNFANLPYFTGVRRGKGDPNFTLPPNQWQFPHKYARPAQRGAINVLFVDGHVGVVVYHEGDEITTSVIR